MKKLAIALLLACMPLSLQACAYQEQTATPLEEEEKSEEITAAVIDENHPFNKPVQVNQDNATFTLDGVEYTFLSTVSDFTENGWVESASSEDRSYIELSKDGFTIQLVDSGTLGFVEQLSADYREGYAPIDMNTSDGFYLTGDYSACDIDDTMMTKTEQGLYTYYTAHHFTDNICTTVMYSVLNDVIVRIEYVNSYIGSMEGECHI